MNEIKHPFIPGPGVNHKLDIISTTPLGEKEHKLEHDQEPDRLRVMGAAVVYFSACVLGALFGNLIWEALR